MTESAKLLVTLEGGVKRITFNRPERRNSVDRETVRALRAAVEESAADGTRVVVLTGAGVKGGQAYGETDEFGYKAAVNPVHVHDLHATILHLLGFDHTRLTYRYAGRDFRLTDVFGNVVKDVLA